MHEQTHDTADDHGKQDTRRASIVYAYFHVHLQKKTNKIWGQNVRAACGKGCIFSGNITQ